MKKGHRRWHALAWFILLPALLTFVFLAERSIDRTPPRLEAVPTPSQAGELP